PDGGHEVLGSLAHRQAVEAVDDLDGVHTGEVVLGEELRRRALPRLRRHRLPVLRHRIPACLWSGTPCQREGVRSYTAGDGHSLHCQLFPPCHAGCGAPKSLSQAYPSGVYGDRCGHTERPQKTTASTRRSLVKTSAQTIRLTAAAAAIGLTLAGCSAPDDAAQEPDTDGTEAAGAASTHESGESDHEGMDHPSDGGAPPEGIEKAADPKFDVGDT